MFEHHTFISKQHHVALESTIRNHSVNSHVSAQMLTKMYKLALAGLAGPVKADGFAVSLLEDARTQVKACAVTETKNGLYLQLAKVGDGQPLLTMGQKWIMESPGVAVIGSTQATMLW